VGGGDGGRRGWGWADPVHMGGRRRVSCAGSGGRVVPISTFFFVRASGNLYFLLCAGQAGSRFSSGRQGWFLISVLFSSMLGR
jgi:hypothetical protein